MSVGASIKVLADGRWTVGKVEGLAAAAGLVGGDEIAAINDKPREKWKRPKLKSGDRLTVIRDGERLTVTLAKPRRSSELKAWLKRIAAAGPDQGDALIKEIWIDNLSGRLPDAEAAEADTAMRKRLAGTPELPLGGPAPTAAPAKPTVRCSGIPDKDRAQWLREFAAKRDYPPEWHRLAEMIASYMHKDPQHRLYMCAWPSQARLSKEIGCRVASVGKGLRAIEAEGHIVVTPRGGGQTSVIEMRLSGDTREEVATSETAAEICAIDLDETSFQENPANYPDVEASDIAEPGRDLIVPPGCAVPVRRPQLSVPQSSKAEFEAAEAARIASAEREQQINWFVENQARAPASHDFAYDPFGQTQPPQSAGSSLPPSAPENPGSGRNWYDGK